MEDSLKALKDILRDVIKTPFLLSLSLIQEKKDGEEKGY